MLKIHLPQTEVSEPVELRLEHSLVSISKWEAKYERPFFGRDGMSPEETMDYIRMMIFNVDPPIDLDDRIQSPSVVAITEYINSKQSATWFQKEAPGKPNSEVTTSELVYYWMITFKIPFVCEDWHFNRLMTLIKICGVKQSQPKKMNRNAVRNQYKDLNAQRRAQLGTNG